MRKPLPRWVRWPLIFALAVALLIVLPIQWVIGLLNGGSLWIAEALRDRIDDLTDTGGKA
jgi:hypothetical protein